MTGTKEKGELVIDTRVIGRKHAARLIVKRAAEKEGRVLSRKERRIAEAAVKKSLKKGKKPS